jgi:hypothetical protein
LTPLAFSSKLAPKIDLFICEKIMVRIRKQMLAAAVVFLMLGSFGVAAQPKKTVPVKKPVPVATKPAAAAPQNTARQTAFDVTGVEKADLYKYIHDGRFRIINRDMRLQMTLEGYVTAFSGMCPSSLSRNKVEITQYVQKYRNETTFLPWGRSLIPLTTQKLDSAGYEGTGIYAEPEFAEAYSRLSAGYLLNFLRGVRSGSLKDVTDALIRSTVDAVETSLQTYSDMNRTLVNNGCDSAATKRFSQNLLRVATGRPSVQRENGEKSFFAKACESKLPGLYPKKSPAPTCSCLEREMETAANPYLMTQLEEKFDAENFNVFLLASVSRAGLQEKVLACIKNT